MYHFQIRLLSLFMFTCLTREQYISLGEQHLAHAATYTPLPTNKTQTLRMQLNKEWKSICSQRHITKRTTNKLITGRCDTQKFYFAVKTHKEGQKIRPIVSNCGGPSERISWLLQKILHQLLPHVAAYLENTYQLLNNLKDLPTDARARKLPVSYDVTAMYTTIPIDEGINTNIHDLQEHKINLYGLQIKDIQILLEIVLHNNIFTFNGKFYRQHQGLAMGSRIAPIIAIMFMNRLECSAVYTHCPVDLTFYRRYVDDTLCLVNSIDDAKSMLNHLNSLHHSVKFELELPNTDNTISLLDVTITIQTEGNI